MINVSGHPFFWCPGADKNFFCGQVVFSEPGDIARILASGPGNSWRRDGLLLRRSPLKTGAGPQSGAPHQDFGARARSVGRFCAGQLALHMVPTMRGCSASTASPSDSKSRPKPPGDLKAGGVASMVRCSIPDSPPRRPSRSQRGGVHARIRPRRPDLTRERGVCMQQCPVAPHPVVPSSHHPVAPIGSSPETEGPSRQVP